MIRAFFRKRNLNISPALCSVKIQEKPFSCILTGEVGEVIKRMDRIQVQQGNYQVEIKTDNCSQKEAGGTKIGGDGWYQDHFLEPLNIQKGGDISTAFSGVKFKNPYQLSKAKNNIKNISQMTLKEQVLSVARMQGFLANCYGDTITTMGKSTPATPTFKYKGRNLKVGATFRYTPDKDWHFFFDKSSYECVEIWGQDNSEISLFETAHWGTVILLERLFSGISQQWRAVFVNL